MNEGATLQLDKEKAPRQPETDRPNSESYPAGWFSSRIVAFMRPLAQSLGSSLIRRGGLGGC